MAALAAALAVSCKLFALAEHAIELRAPAYHSAECSYANSVICNCQHSRYPQRGPGLLVSLVLGIEGLRCCLFVDFAPAA
jgi:hypothetical protein